MADAIEQHRATAEAELATILQGLNKKARGKVQRAIVEYGSVEAIPEEFWENLKQGADEEAAAALLLLLLAVYSTENLRIGRRLSGEDKAAAKDLRNRDGAAAAAGVAAQLGRQAASDYVDGARIRLAKTLDPSATQADQRRTIDDIFDDKQVERTTSTTTTRGVTIGQDSAGKDIETATGVRLRTYWVTERDARVCPRCRPLHNKPQEEWETIIAGSTQLSAADKADTLAFIGQGPPAHPNCRCSTRRTVMASDN